jgi:hypothetical protein
MLYTFRAFDVHNLWNHIATFVFSNIFLVFTKLYIDLPVGHLCI